MPEVRRCRGRKKEAPAFDEGEEARLRGGLWTSLITSMTIVSLWLRDVNFRRTDFLKRVHDWIVAD